MVKKMEKKKWREVLMKMKTWAKMKRKKAAWVPMNHLPNPAVSILLASRFSALLTYCCCYLFCFYKIVMKVLFAFAVDETENERRRNECLNDMADLERQFSDLKEQWVELSVYLLVLVKHKYIYVLFLTTSKIGLWQILVSLFRLYRERINQVEKKLEEVKSGMFSRVGWGTKRFGFRCSQLVV